MNTRIVLRKVWSIFGPGNPYYPDEYAVEEMMIYLPDVSRPEEEEVFVRKGVGWAACPGTRNRSRDDSSASDQ